MNILLVFTGFIIVFIVVLYYERKIRNISVTKNKVHFYVARDKNGALWLYIGKPERSEQTFWSDCCVADIRHFDRYGLDIKDYDNLKFEDEPVEVFINIED